MNNQKATQTSDFIVYAIECFKKLGWSPANPADLSRPDLVVYGNVNKDGQGVVCVVDPLAMLFKVELDVRNENTVINCKVVKKYSDSSKPNQMLDEALDAVGGLYGDLCRRKVGGI